MGKKIKLFVLAVFVAFVAYIYPSAKQKYVKHVKPNVELAVNFSRKVANLKILGKQVPWKFILPVVGVLLVLLYVRRRKKKFQKLKEEDERRKAELAAQYKALGGPILNPEQDNQPKPTQPPTQATATTNDGDIGRRIQSFSEWSSTNTVNVFSLARAGFQYTGREDVVECFKCKGTLKEWEQNDDPLASHQQYYPDCEFLKKRVSEAEIEKLSCRKRIDDLLAASSSCVNKLKEMQKMKLSGDKTEESRMGEKILETNGLRNLVNELKPELIETQKHLADLQKRLDTTERTMHLVMKQMEAVTKCLARTLENDASGDVKEINDGLKVMKESNV